MVTRAGDVTTADEPMATCPHDGEPVIFTFERTGLEFACVVCGRWFEYFGPPSAAWTQELQDRHDELKVTYLAQRAEREEARRG